MTDCCIRAETIERCEAKASGDRYRLREHALALIFMTTFAFHEASGRMVFMSLPQLASRRQVLDEREVSRHRMDRQHNAITA